mmetsp:Transcript_1056/g.1865  ORF Transcript_1056/g.1865 Transcript_1056/m.1865 type:complete len:179 (-) Transcript_1056:49-585(-)
MTLAAAVPRCHSQHGDAMSEDRNADVRPQTLAEPGQTEARDEVDDTALPRPWHCFGPLLQLRSEGHGRRPSGRSLGVCFCGAGNAPRLTHEVGCSLFPAHRNSGPWRCAILPADSDGEAEPTPPTPTPPSEHMGDNLDSHLEPTTSATRGSESISVTSTCSPSPAMDSHDSPGSKASP